MAKYKYQPTGEEFQVTWRNNRMVEVTDGENKEHVLANPSPKGLNYKVANVSFRSPEEAINFACKRLTDTRSIPKEKEIQERLRKFVEDME